MSYFYVDLLVLFLFYSFDLIQERHLLCFLEKSLVNVVWIMKIEVIRWSQGKLEDFCEENKRCIINICCYELELFLLLNVVGADYTKKNIYNYPSWHLSTYINKEDES